MAKSKLEYIWLDGYTPTQNMRSKTKVVEDFSGKLEDCPIWAFDGSSTKQAEGDSSDCLLKPVAIFSDPERVNGFLVMTEVLNADSSPHNSNARAQIDDDDNDFWFGFEQEYFIMDVETQLPLGFPLGGYPGPQGLYYCGVGPQNVQGREIADKHLTMCIEAGINISGTNAEVMVGQWEYQCFAEGAKRSADDAWISRYIMHRLVEKYNVVFNLHPKPIKGDWNGTGMHTNFSNTEMRDVGGKGLFTDLCKKLEMKHDEHIAVYGADNDQRLTGLHETQHISKFSYGESDRGASVRIPLAVVESNWQGYLEDRRPSGNADPYQVVKRIIDTLG